ncbi:BirA family transcriptional regulator, biotin operon repressor / biotin---[acetyl-CoA-carboxylase] ligase [Nematocida sp. AWRm77]|nr:BirA family transcriptional regulator, biotin operon repressor / biotin---[acetyl-CoA-carboxylase] ligase [Nematocida sp. AWRm77]
MIKRFQELPSTQEYCLERLEEFGEFGCAIAAKQTKGIGRAGRNWLSTEGSLSFSVVMQSPRIESITIRASKAIKNVLEEFGVAGLVIKWPNDLYIGRPGKKSKKIGGVLVNTINIPNKENTVKYVIGVGLNIGGTNFSYCTLEECGVLLDKEAVFQRLLQKFREIQEGSQKGSYSYTELGFEHNYVNFQDKKYEIISVTDRLQITDGYSVLTIDPEEYSYIMGTNSLCTK